MGDEVDLGIDDAIERGKTINYEATAKVRLEGIDFEFSVPYYYSEGWNDDCGIDGFLGEIDVNDLEYPEGVEGREEDCGKSLSQLTYEELQYVKNEVEKDRRREER